MFYVFKNLSKTLKLISLFLFSQKSTIEHIYVQRYVSWRRLVCLKPIPAILFQWQRSLGISSRKVYNMEFVLRSDEPEKNKYF
jgi:histidinol phosphatase-like enzyme